MARTNVNYRRLYVYFFACNSGLGYAYWSYNLSIFNSLQKYLQNYIFPDASTTQISLIASFLSAGAILGSLIASPALSKFGRRATMLGADILGIIGLVLTIVASLPSMLIGRFISGIVGGINTVVIPVYLVEMSPLPLCGASGSLSIIVLELFAFVSLALSFAVPSNPEGGINDQVWRILFLIPILFNLTRFICLKFIFDYETPFLHIQKQDNQKARSALSRIFTYDTDREFERINHDVQASSSEGSVRIRDLFSRKYGKNLFVSFLLAVIQQFCGMGAIFVFSNDIFSSSTDDPELFSTLLGVINLCAVIASFALIEKFGRRPLLIIGTFLIAIDLLIFAIISKADEGNPALKYILLVWPIFFQMSLGSLTFLYVSEALPSVGVSVCIAANWTSGFLISQFYLHSVETFGLIGPFLFFSLFSLLCAVVFWRMMVETKGKTKSEIISVYTGVTPTEIEPTETIEQKDASPQENVPVDKAIKAIYETQPETERGLNKEDREEREEVELSALQKINNQLIKD